MWNLQDQLWSDPAVLSVNREPERAHFYPFDTEAAARDGRPEASARIVCLNGKWLFRWLPTPLMVNETVIAEPADAAHGYAPITVPRNWQFAGYGRMLYTDEAYPFPLDPPRVPADNETGVYKRVFHWTATAGKRLFIRFEGVESAFSLYINGAFAGYSQGSRMPSEFEITALARSGGNELCAVVYQYSDGAYLEDQDMWWLGGIIRDVRLLERPESYLQDLTVNADYDPVTGDGLLTARARVSGEGAIRYALYGPDEQPLSEGMTAEPGGTISLRIPGAQAWNAEQPYLYTLTALLYHDGVLLEAVPQRVGFRRVEIKEGVLMLNGRRIMMRGVNRHEFDPENGRAVSAEMTECELKLIKNTGMNAVRTSHYPNIPAFYDICDRIGLYVIDECDLETHGFEIEGEPKRLADDPDWEEAYLDRARRLLARDRNRACVILWSLGNESGTGANLAAMYRWMKAADPGRPVHYEPDRFCAAADVSSSMYTPLGALCERDLAQTPLRPHILCEFGHAMGNGPGGLAEYIETCESSRRIQGYFIWEWKDHGVATRRADGAVYYRYGGEFGERYTSGSFCMDGLMFADGTPSPGYWEYRYLIAPVTLEKLSVNKARLTNRRDFAALHKAKICGELRRDGALMNAWTQTLPPVKAREACGISIPAAVSRAYDNALWTLTLTVREAVSADGTQEERELGAAHWTLREYEPQACAPAGSMHAVCEADRIRLVSDDCSLNISLRDGSLFDYTFGGVPRLIHGPSLNFFRAYTDNDRKLAGTWQEQHLHSMRMTVHTAKVTQEAAFTRVTLTGAFAPDARAWRARVRIVYEIDAAGRVKASYSGDFRGGADSGMPAELPKLGTRTCLPKSFGSVVYCGLGPGESYCDSCASARMGIYRCSAADMQTLYEVPQDNGNRTGVSFTAVTGLDGAGVAFASLTPVDMSLRTQEDIDLWRAAHIGEVPESDDLILHFDMRNSGLGSGSCGPNHMAQYAVYTRPFAFAFAIVPVSAGTDAVVQARAAQGYLLGLEREEKQDESEASVL